MIVLRIWCNFIKRVGVPTSQSHWMGSMDVDQSSMMRFIKSHADRDLWILWNKNDGRYKSASPFKQVHIRALHWVSIPMPMLMGFGWAWVQCYYSWVGIGFVHPYIQLQIGVKLLGCREYANQEALRAEAKIVNDLLFVRSNQNLM